jgi:hypothetical protein
LSKTYITFVVLNKQHIKIKVMKITVKSTTNANGLKGIVISLFRIKKAWVLIKEGDIINALYFFHAGCSFREF